MRKTHKDWPEDFYLVIDKFTQKMRRYGFVTDHDQVFEQLGTAILVMQHKLPNVSLDDLMGVTLMAEIFDLPHKERKEELRKLTSLYANYFQARKEKKRLKERRAARSIKKVNRSKHSAKKGKG